MSRKLFLIGLWVMSFPLMADDIRVAVASNFIHAMKEIAGRFEQQTGHRIILSAGSTGKHYAQIRNGAPFDIFFAADSHRPELLENEGIAVAGSRFTYAQGRLVLWSPDPKLIDGGAGILAQGNFNHLAIANPKLAPYGKAAQQVLQAEGLWQQLRRKMVRGENIGQTFQFVKSGNAQLGFVAYSQLKQVASENPGSSWLVPQSLYSPIKQQAVLLNNTTAAQAFLEFIGSQQVLNILADFGYDSAHAD